MFCSLERKIFAPNFRLFLTSFSHTCNPECDCAFSLLDNSLNYQVLKTSQVSEIASQMVEIKAFPPLPSLWKETRVKVIGMCRCYVTRILTHGISQVHKNSRGSQSPTPGSTQDCQKFKLYFWELCHMLLELWQASCCGPGEFKSPSCVWWRPGICWHLIFWEPWNLYLCLQFEGWCGNVKAAFYMLNRNREVE